MSVGSDPASGSNGAWFKSQNIHKYCICSFYRIHVLRYRRLGARVGKDSVMDVKVIYYLIDLNK